LFVDVRLHDLKAFGSRKRRLSGDQVEEHAAERVDITTMVNLGVAHTLFGARVERGSSEALGVGDTASHMNDSKVQDLGKESGRGEPLDHNIIGLEIAMDEP